MFRRFVPALVVSMGLLAACGTAAPALSDPEEILTQGIAKTAELNTFHMSVGLDGSVSVPDVGGEFSLDNVTLEGDFDLEAQDAHLTFAMPTLFGLEGEVITDGTDMYTRMSVMGEGWTKTPVTESVEVPALDPQEILAGVQDFLDTEGVEAEKLEDAECGERQCYVVRLTIPSELLAEAGAAASMDPSEVFGEELVVDLQFDRQELWLTGASASVASDTVGSFALNVTFSAFNEAVEITPPPADEVTEGEPTLPF